jgi:hypothetical protein
VPRCSPFHQQARALTVPSGPGHSLEDHKTLKGQYKPRDKRFVTQAVDEQAHCGYQQWHRDVDAEVVKWLKDNIEATAKQFEAMLRLIYNRPEMRARFPNGY